VLEIHDKSGEDETVSVVREPRRRWLVAAAAASVVIVAGVALAGGGEDGDPVDTATPATDTTTAAPTTPQDVLTLWDTDDVVLERGVYSIDPDGDDSTSLRVTFEIDADGWKSWMGAVKFSESSHIILSITTIDNLVREGCIDHAPADPPVGPTVDDLATALGGLAPFEVTKPASDVTVFGYPGQHLQWTVPDLAVVGSGDDRNFADCHSDVLHSWSAPNLDGSFYGYNGEPGRTEDFWILDVEGTRLVIITTASPAAPQEDLREMDAIFDSIQIEV
jgi:hypothetical protein